MKKFCPNCGNPLRPNAKFCPKCGTQLQSAATPTTPQNPTPSRQQINRTPKKPMSKKNKIILGVVIGVVIVFAGFYAWGSHYYSKDNQIDRAITALKNPKQGLASYVTTNSNVEVNDKNLKPLQNYYQENQSQANKAGQAFKEGNDYGKLSLVENGRNLLLFPKYKISVSAYTPTITTNHDNSTLLMNGKKVGTLMADSSQKLSPIFPGKYNFVVKSKVSGRNLSANSDVKVWSNSSINMNIETKNFTVKSVPDGIVYINDKKAGTLDKNGKLTFNEYPVTKNMSLYVTTEFKGKTLKSNLISQLGAAMVDAWESDIDDDDYTNSDSTDTVIKDGDNYVVQPQWEGVISKDDVSDLLQTSFDDPDSDDFIDGENNKDYKDIKAQNDRWDDAYDYNDAKVEVESVSPAGDNLSGVNFRVTYELDDGDTTKVQVVEYSNAIIQKYGSNYKIKTIGDGKMTSNKTEED